MSPQHVQVKVRLLCLAAGVAQSTTNGALSSFFAGNTRLAEDPVPSACFCVQLQHACPALLAVLGAAQNIRFGTIFFHAASIVEQISERKDCSAKYAVTSDCVHVLDGHFKSTAWIGDLEHEAFVPVRSTFA